MPEFVEVLLWVLVARYFCANLLFDSIFYEPSRLKPNEDHVPKEDLQPAGKFQLIWSAWGKCIEVIIITADRKQKKIFISLSTHGQIVLLDRAVAVALPEVPLAFISGDKAVCVWHRHAHFIRVKASMKTRGPTVLWEFDKFKTNLQEYCFTNASKKTPIAKLLLDQQYFNGIGNYLRAEILFAAKLNPFDSAYSVITNKETFRRLVIRSILALVGDSYNPYDFELGAYFLREHIKVYGKAKHVEYPKGRTLWYADELKGDLIELLPQQNPDRQPRAEQVGPYCGWDLTVACSFTEPINFNEDTKYIIRIGLGVKGRPPKGQGRKLKRST